MGEKKVKLIITVLGIFLTVAILIGCANNIGPENVKIERYNDTMEIMYRKLISYSPSLEYDLLLYQYDRKTQKVASKAGEMSSNDGTIGYFLDSDNLQTSMFLIDANGNQQCISSEVLFTDFQIDESGSKIAYHHCKDDILIIEDKHTQDETKISNCGYWWEMSKDGGTVAYINNYDGYPENVGDWGVLKVYKNGQSEIIAEQAFLVARKSLSSDGETIIYVVNFDTDTAAGDLYIKRAGAKATLLTQNSSVIAKVSDDGQFVAAIIDDEGNMESLFYQYGEGESQIVKGVNDFSMSGDGSTLIYKIFDEENNTYKLYAVEQGQPPMKLSDDVMVVCDISNDGSIVAYLTNYDVQSKTGDLYLLYDDLSAELIDTGVTTSMWARGIRLNDAGDAVAYLKNYGKTLTGDLYVKYGSDEPKKIDSDVNDFDFIE